VRSHARRHARAGRRAPADGHAQPAAERRERCLSGGLPGDHRHRAGQAALAPGTRRWFDLDDAALQAGLAQRAAADPLRGPRARRAGRHARAGARGACAHRPRPARRSLARHAGRPARMADHAARRRPAAVLRRAAHAHPVGPGAPDRRHAPSGLALRALRAAHPRASALAAALSAIGMAGMPVDAGPPNLVAVLDTPRGPVTLESKGL
jgi:hypothetical protein